VGKKEDFYNIAENECKLVEPLWKAIWRSLKKSKNRTTISSRDITPGHMSKRM
jgi:hypothetical protein